MSKMKSFLFMTVSAVTFQNSCLASQHFYDDQQPRTIKYEVVTSAPSHIIPHKGRTTTPQFMLETQGAHPSPNYDFHDTMGEEAKSYTIQGKPLTSSFFEPQFRLDPTENTSPPKEFHLGPKKPSTPASDAPSAHQVIASPLPQFHPQPTDNRRDLGPQKPLTYDVSDLEGVLSFRVLNLEEPSAAKSQSHHGQTLNYQQASPSFHDAPQPQSYTPQVYMPNNQIAHSPISAPKQQYPAQSWQAPQNSGYRGQRAPQQASSSHYGGSYSYGHAAPTDQHYGRKPIKVDYPPHFTPRTLMENAPVLPAHMLPKTSAARSSIFDAAPVLPDHLLP